MSARSDALRRLWRRAREETIGLPLELPSELRAAFPVLDEARWRRGGVLLRIGGWCLGARTVAGFTLGGTVYIARGPVSPRLLLHELGHVRQYRRAKSFPMRYLWESLLHGYARNRFELEADQFAEEVIWSGTPRRPS
jgi:hypothetical protein